MSRYLVKDTNLIELRAKTNEILKDLQDKSRKDLDLYYKWYSEPVNWTDLRCVEARRIVNDEGFEYWEVIVSKAAPEADKLREWVCDKLKESGHGDIGVVTEW